MLRASTALGALFTACALLLPLLPGGAAGQEDARAGWAARQIYLENCAGCHGFDRTGFIGVPLDPVSLDPLSEAALRSLVRHGIQDTLMPSWDCRLSLPQLRLLSRYLKRTQPERERRIEIGPDGSPGPASDQAWWKAPESIERGRALFMDYCMGCHHPEYEAFAPSYREVTRKRDIRAIWGQIKFPYTSSALLGYSGQIMPKFELTDREIGDLGAFVHSFQGPETP